MEREQFSFDIVLTAPFLFWTREKVIRVSFEQANIKQLFNFLEDIEQGKEIGVRVVEFVEKYATRRLTPSNLSSVYMSSGKIFNVLYDTFFKGCFSRTDDNKKRDAVKNYNPAPMQANIAFLAKETCTNIIDLYEECTIQDIEYLMEGVIWNLNSQTKEGQKRNKMRIIEKKAEQRTQEERDAIKAKLDKIPD